MLEIQQQPSISRQHIVADVHQHQHHHQQLHQRQHQQQHQRHRYQKKHVVLTDTPDLIQSHHKGTPHHHHHHQQRRQQHEETPSSIVARNLSLRRLLSGIISNNHDGTQALEVACLSNAFSNFQKALCMTFHLSNAHPEFLSRNIIPSSSWHQQRSAIDPPRFFSTGERDVIYHQALPIQHILQSVSASSDPKKRLMLVVVSLLFNMAACFHLKAISSFDRRIQNASLQKAKRFYIKAYNFLLSTYPSFRQPATSHEDDATNFVYLVLANNLSSVMSAIQSRQAFPFSALQDEPTYAEQLITFAQNMPPSNANIEECRKTFLLHALLVRNRATHLAPAA